MELAARPVPVAEDRILDGLSSAQRDAVLHGDGPLLIIAGAGTGKTTVLTRRIAHLIASKRARPEEILALTFTEKAAAEMAERVDQLIPYGYAETWIGTFHAFGDRVLREGALEAGLNPEFRVLARPEQIIFLRERLFRLPLAALPPAGRSHAAPGGAARPRRAAPRTRTCRPRSTARGPRPPRGGGGRPRRRSTRPRRQVELAAFYETYQRLLAEAGARRLRRPDPPRPRAAARRAGGARRAARALPLRPGRRVPGHEPRAARAGAPAGGRGTGPEHHGGGRRRPGDLPLARRRRREPARVPALLPGRARGGADREPPLDPGDPRRVRAAHLLQQPAPAGGRRRHRQAAALRAARRARGACTCTSTRCPPRPTASPPSSASASQAGYRPRDVAMLVRSNGDADPFLRALNVHGIPHRFSGSRGLYAREEVRLLVAFLRALANPEDSISVFYLAASELYRLPASELLRLNHYARRKSRPLLEVLRGLPANEELVGIGGATREARRCASWPTSRRAAEDVPRLRTGEVLYRFLQASGLLARFSREASAEAEPKVRNIARFFDAVRSYGEIAEHDRVPAFVEHLDLLREAGDDPAVAEADFDDDAVSVLTVHKAKGLEFRCRAHGRLRAGPLPAAPPHARRWSCRPTCSGDPGTGGDAHLQEERRLFYVGMTRAKDELVLTSAADYGTARPRKVSRFVVEALDLPSPSPLPRRSRALEALARHQPEPATEPPVGRSSRGRLSLSFRQLDDYATCPLKYQYVHVWRVPLLTHHRVVFGSAVHKAVQRHFQARLDGPSVRRGRARGGVPRGLGVRGLPLARARGAAPAGGGGDAAPVPSRRCGSAPASHRRRAGLRVLRGRDEGGGPLRPGGRGRGPRHPPRLQDGRRATTRARRRSARRRASSSTSTRSRTCGRAGGCPTGSSCASWRRGSPADAAHARARRGDGSAGAGGRGRRARARVPGAALRTSPAGSARSATSARTRRAPTTSDRNASTRASSRTI